jgi:hypothetical protein
MNKKEIEQIKAIKNLIKYINTYVEKDKKIKINKSKSFDIFIDMIKKQYEDDSLENTNYLLKEQIRYIKTGEWYL